MEPQDRESDRQETKACSKCQTTKALQEFFNNKTRPDGKHHYCKPCHSQYQTNNPETTRRYVLIREYGITLEQYQQMLIDQKESCRICGVHQETQTKRLFVDHCHETGKVRGLLCYACNTLLGLAKDRLEVLEKAVEYLKDSRS